MTENGVKVEKEKSLHEKLDEVIKSLKQMIEEKQKEHQEVMKKLERLG